MDKTLRQLYRGEIQFDDKIYSCSNEYEAQRQLCKTLSANFVKTLNPVQTKEFNRILDEQWALCPIEVESAFADGFRLGVKMMVAVFMDDKIALPENA